MHPVAALFGFACLGTIAGAWHSRVTTARALSWAMVVVWAAANLAWANHALALMALVDLPLAVIGYAIWFEGRKGWQAAFAFILGARVFLLIDYPGTGEAGEAAFLHLYNFTFLAALIAVCWKGGISNAVGSAWRSVRALWVRLSLAVVSSGLATLARP